MMIRHLVRDLRQRVPQWDTPSKIALISGLILFPLLLLIGFAGPEPIQIPARVGAFGLLLTLQLIILWGNRKSLSPYHQAQEYFMHSDYESAREILEQLPYKDSPSVDALILLGNTYRHLGMFEQSQEVLEHALSLKPDYHFGLYGMGKLQLVMGQYGDASNFITKALSQGAPDVVQFDLGQAYYLVGDMERATHHFNNIVSIIQDEPSQYLLVQYYLHQMGQQEQPSDQLIQNNVSYWQNEADKYHATPYGQALQADVDTLTSWLQGV